MTETERKVLQELADAYRILREAYYRDMHREAPATNAIQLRVKEILSLGVDSS